MFSVVGVRWAALGLAGATATTLAGADLLRDKPIRWWFDPHLPARGVVFYAGIAALCVAWLAIGRRLRRAGRPDASGDDRRVRQLLLVGALWAIPMLLAPSLISRDLYSYLADGALLHHGLDPFRHAPDALSGIGQGHLQHAVSPFWRHTTAPYGPGFVGLAALIAGATGGHLIAGVLLLRLLELAGVALLATFVPRLARALGADPGIAVWLAVISPLVLLELLGAGHNDALMVGLLVAGVTLALERRPLLGIALCAAATTIKLPAAAGIVFIAVAWARSDPDRRAGALLKSTVVAGGVLALVSLATGLGPDWITGSLSTPAKVRLAITPSTALGHTTGSALHALGVVASSRAIESAVGVIALALTALLGLWLLVRVRFATLPWYLGLLLLASVLGGPAAWPWYAIWGLALIACCPPVERWRWLPLVIAATTFLIRADGQLVLPREASPVMLALYATAAIVLLARRRQNWEPPLSRVAEFAQ
ncbi:MAG: polyprenol phosphomannose-dependent alpha 1,6 mannosyltransferase MptB [Solirubrobacteraceae bacterium]